MSEQISEQQLVSRFFNTDDQKENNIFYELPNGWWSRVFEYVWAGSLVSSEDVVLDTAAGVCHPFKFYLSDKAKEVHAIDLDARVSNLDEIKKDIIHFVGKPQSEIVKQEDVDKIKFTIGNISNLTYEDQTFDKIFNISVLEHVDTDTQIAAMKEFYRVLKDDGLLIVTVDYPDVTPVRLIELVAQSGFEFAGQIDYAIGDKAISGKYAGKDLKCFRAVLRKKIEPKIESELPVEDDKLDKVENVVNKLFNDKPNETITTVLKGETFLPDKPQKKNIGKKK